jgi:hypothetical protein
VVSISAPASANVFGCSAHFRQKIVTQFNEPLEVELLFLKQIEQFRLFHFTLNQFVFEIDRRFALVLFGLGLRESAGARESEKYRGEYEFDSQMLHHAAFETTDPN